MAVQVSGDPDPANNGLFHIYADHLGSTGSLSDSSGVYIPNSHAKYTPFGDWRTEPTATAGDRYYTNHKHNNLGGGADDLGLIYMNARFYLPSVGRFASVDTIIPDHTNPQSLNRFSYTRNNPINLIDPSGHKECSNADCADSSPPDHADFDWNDPAASLIGWWTPGAGTEELANAMKILYYFPEDSPHIQFALETIATIQGLTESQVNYQYDLFKDLKSTAERNGWTKNLVTVDEWWGDINQLRFGKIVGDELGLNPIFGALLSPTGGYIGPGMKMPDLHNDLSTTGSGEAWLYHAAVHDAAGYLYNYHGVGPGYTYGDLDVDGNPMPRRRGSPYYGQNMKSYWDEELGLALDLNPFD